MFVTKINTFYFSSITFKEKDLLALVVKPYTASSKTKISAFCPQYTYVFHMISKMNRNYFSVKTSLFDVF